jgi:UDP-N-acetylglucosamine/UDP-N-acetylgalactosamine diphosphorylase
LYSEEAIVPWYVMTSFATDLPTRQYFAKHNYFGLNKENIFFFNQDLFPCIFEDGKVIMKKKYKVWLPLSSTLNSSSV